MGYNVKAFCFQDSPRRAHSIAAQGGINAADFNSRSTEKDRYISLGVPSLTNDGTDYVVHLYVSVAIRSNSNKTLKSVTASITQ